MITLDAIGMPPGTGKTTWAMKYPDSLVDIDTICCSVRPEENQYPNILKDSKQEHLEIVHGKKYSNRYYNKLHAASRTKNILDAIKINPNIKNKIFLIHQNKNMVISPLHFNILVSVKPTLQEIYDVAAQRLQFNGSSTPRLIEWWEESDAIVLCRCDIDKMLQHLINIDKSII